MNDIEKRVTHCFRNMFPALAPDEIAKAGTSSLPAWDSIAHISLLSSVAEEFGVAFEIEDFEELVSYRLIVDWLENHAANG